MNIPYVFKRCTKCGEWLVASTYNFNKMKNGKYGLQPKCNKCRKEYRNANKDNDEFNEFISNVVANFMIRRWRYEYNS